jgi:hypothetical protein
MMIMCGILVHRWRCVQFETGSAFKLDLKNNGVVRRSSQDSDVSEDFSAILSALVRCFAENMHACIHACNNFMYLVFDIVRPSVFIVLWHTLFLTYVTDLLLCVYKKIFLVWNFYGKTLQGKRVRA